MTHILYYSQDGKIVGVDKRDLETFKTSMPFIELDFEPDGTIFTDYDFDLDTLILVKKPKSKIDARVASGLLAEAKAVKLREIEDDYILAESDSVTYKTFDFNGGEDSATSIDKYVRLNRLGGATSHTVWDITNVDRTLTDVEADELLLAIGGASSLNKFTRKNRKVALKKATTLTKVKAV